MKKLSFIVVIGASAICANAAIWNLNLIGRSENNALTGGNEVPAVDTPARGGELSDFDPINNPGLQYDDAINQLAVRLGFGATGIGYAADLEGTFSGAHIHGPGDISTSAPVLYDLGPITSLQAGSRSGTISGFITLSDTDEARLFGNELYVNIHSSVNPDGEIRGNLSTIPEPQTYGIAGALALLAFAGYRRWKTVPTA